MLVECGLLKRESQRDKKDYFGMLFKGTVEDWDKDDLSRDALILLLKLTSTVKPCKSWGLFSTAFFNSDEKFKSALNELVSKGYAVPDNNDTYYYIRNDKTIPWKF